MFIKINFAITYEKLVTFIKDAKKQLKVVRQDACALKQQAEVQKYVAEEEARGIKVSIQHN